jgi:hypothetical protein
LVGLTSREPVDSNLALDKVGFIGRFKLAIESV